ncbi:MAG: threonine synthase [Eubacteriales bacterium]
MHYISTRNHELHHSVTHAMVQGLADDGGLFVPAYIPKLHKNALEDMKPMAYSQRAVYLMKLFLEGYSVRELNDYTQKAYSTEKFDTPEITPVVEVTEGTYALELWHGPTCAFKDLALQMLPHLLTSALTKEDESKTACILVATSGDTGKGALEGFRDVPKTKVMVFYPKGGVSAVQELQMVSQEGNNVGVTAVVGNFDDAQTGVKNLFQNQELAQEAAARGFLLSSANSINWGRVLPQIVYYASVYCDLLVQEKIQMGDPVNICVPTGNFGNILAAYYAKQMGVPIDKLICASNENDVLTDFLQTGEYNRNRPFYNTTSPSMDILISSNLERLLYALSLDTDWVAKKMEELAQTGKYQVEENILTRITRTFKSYRCDSEQAAKTIQHHYKKNGYLMDTHTAVGFHALEQYRAETGDTTPSIVASTASPFKFTESVLEALGIPRDKQKKELDGLDQLAETSKVLVPYPLATLRGKETRFHEVVEKEDMISAVRSFLR